MSEANLLVATDLLPKSEAALSRAALLAKTLHADITLLHVVPPEPAERALDARRVNVRHRLHALVRAQPWPMRSPPTTLVRSGVPGRAIPEAAAEQEATLLVLGPHEPGTPRDQIVAAFGGSVAVRALAARACPVLVVRERPRHAYRRVLLALDLSPNAADVVRAAETLVLDSRADASVLHAQDVPYFGTVEPADGGRGMSARYSSLWRSHATVNVRALLRRSSRDFGRYGIQIDDAPPARAILDAMKQQEPDLLVMGTSGRGPVGRALLGSVANQVLSEGWCDMLVVPQGSLQPRDRAPSEEVAHRRALLEPTQPTPLHRR